MKDEWVSVEEDTPQIAPPYKNLTEDVYVKFSDGKVGIGYYNYRDCQWHSQESKKYRDGDVVAWKSM